MLIKNKLYKSLSMIFIVAILLSSARTPNAVAQSSDGLKRQVNAESGKVSFIGPASGSVLPASKALGTLIRPRDPAMAFVNRYAPEFGIKDPAHELSKIKTNRSEDGRVISKYQQQYQGIPVIGGELIVDTNQNGDLYSMNGEVSPDLALQTQPKIDSAQARQTALQALAKWNQKTPADFFASTPELWIYDESLLRPSTRPAELVWRMEVTPTDASIAVRELVLVDAQTGGISLHFNQIDTEWGGTQTENTQQVAKTTTENFPINSRLSNSEPSTINASAKPVPALSGGVIWYVATTGNDANDCATTSTPCATINAAIGKASEGDTIEIAVGTYTGTGFEVVLINKNITLSGGWDTSFTTQNGTSTIDGQGARRGITIPYSYPDLVITDATVERLTIQTGIDADGNGGGGIENRWGTLTLNNSIVSNNASHWMGGGIYNSGTLTINNTTISGNSAGQLGHSGGGGGGGIENYEGTLALNNSTVSGNTILGSFDGSGIDAHGTVILNNSTVSGNTGSDGTGIYTLVGTVILNNSTISFNQSYGFMSNSGTVTLRNTIIAGNGAGRDCYNYGGTVNSLGYNLIGKPFGCAFTPTAGDKVNIDPNLGPLVGFPGYHPLLPGSPAIDAGANCLSIDERGVSRPQGVACDIGAFEYRGNGTTPAYLMTFDGTPQNVYVGKPAPKNLKVLVFDAIGDGVLGTTVTFTAPASGPSATFANTSTNVSTSITDTDGFATSSIVSANHMLGSYTIFASVTNLADPVGFQLTNVPQQIKTYTANNSSSLPGSFLCDQSQPSCTNGANPHADAAHKYAIGTYNFYANNFLRDSIDNNGMTITSSVHYCDPYYGCPYDNAFWSGSQMVYGDKRGWPLADDVVAHELTHGVTQYESNLFYYYQSGAINESLSDVFGEYYDQTNGLGTDITNINSVNVKWLISEDAGSGGIGAIRSMSNPPVYGDPDKMSSPNYYIGANDNGGVHYNSGINNKAVYLMVDGGTFNGKTINGLGWEKVGVMYYEVNTNLLTSGADYSDLYYALQQACMNLIGQHGITAGDCTQVQNAMDAVEMYAQPVPNFNNEAPYCDVGNPVSTVFFDDFESGSTNWDFGALVGSTRWQYDSPYGPFAPSGVHMLYANDYPASVTDTYVKTKYAIHIPMDAFMRFDQAFGFEDGAGGTYDGGILEYSTNNGANWQDAGPLFFNNGYNGTVDTRYGNPLGGRAAFVKDSHGYISSRVNLQPLVNQDVLFRWRMGLDYGYADQGWWLDNIKIYTCNIPLSRDTTGVFRPSNGLLYLKNTNVTGFADVAINYGTGGDYPVVGDWDGNGTATIGIYRNAYFYLRNSNTLGFADLVFAFGQPGDQPVAGDWNGDGIDTIGVYRPSTGQFLLRDDNSPGATDYSFYLGNVGDVGIAGDWTGKGFDTVGVFRPSNGVIFLKNTNQTGFADIALNYGLSGDQPVTGDWNGDGMDTIGVYRNGQFLLRNSNTIGFADIAFYLGIPGDMPIGGNWDNLP